MSQSQINTNRPPLLSSVKLPCHLLSLWLGRTGVLAGYKRRIVITTREDLLLQPAEHGPDSKLGSFWSIFWEYLVLPIFLQTQDKGQILGARDYKKMFIFNSMSGGRWSAGQFLYLFDVLEMIESRWRYTEDIKIIPHILCSTYNFIASQPSQARQKIKL